MPVVINELTIKAKVKDDAAKNEKKNEGCGDDKDKKSDGSSSCDCVEKVLEVLRRQKER